MGTSYLARAYQFKFDGGAGTAASVIYLDNIYFYRAAAGTDANLGDLRVGGTTVSGFSSSTLSYNVTVPYGTTTVPTVTATTTDSNATTVITPASTISGTTTVVVTSQDGTATKTYTVGFQVAPPNTACAGTDTNTGFTTGYTYSFTTISPTSVKVTFVVLDADKNTSNGDFQVDNGSYTNLVRTGNSYTATLTGLTTGQTKTFKGHFVNGSGAYFTKTYTYVVGNDCQAPTGVTATVGAVTKTSVELLLNGTDNSSVIYNVTGSGTTQVTSPSGTVKSVIFNHLSPNTPYTFNVVAKDAFTNLAASIPVTVTTPGVSNTACAGTSDEDLAQGTFTSGYTYAFATDYNNNPTVTFTLLDSGRTVHSSSSLWRENTDGTNFQANVPGAVTISGKTVTVKLTGLAVNDTYHYAMKFVFNEGGMAVTKYFTYKVGENCGVVPVDMDSPTGITATLGVVTKNSVELLVNGTDNSGTVIYNVTGGATQQVTAASGVQKSIIFNNLTPDTAYTFNVTAKDAADNAATAISVSTTTLKDVDTEKPTAFTVTLGTITPNSVELKLKATDNSNKIVYKVTYNGTTLSILADSDVEKVLTINSLIAATDYDFSIVVSDEAGNDMDAPFSRAARTNADPNLGLEDAQLSSNNIKLYPNPANQGMVNIEAGDLKVSKVEVYSILGAKILETNKTAISTANLQSGIYLVKISAEGKSVTRKLIVN
jgi:hypothetical protein